MMDGDFDEDDLFGAINAVDISDTAQGGGGMATAPDDDDDALNQQLESMGLTNTDDEQKRKNTMMAMAPPPASAPPPAPTKSPTSTSTTTQKDALMQSLMMGSVGGGGGGGDIVRENSEEEDLFGAISGSGDNGGDEDGDLFGIGDEEDDDDDLFQTTVMEEQQQSQSTSATNTKPTTKNCNGVTTTSDDDQGGIVIAPPNDPLSSSILDHHSSNNGRHYEQQQGNAMMMSYAPTGEESFYRTHNESQFLGTAKPKPNNNSNQYMQHPSQQQQQQQQRSIAAPSPPSENHYSTNFVPVFNNVVVGEPKFISEGGGGGGVRLLSTLTGGSSSKYWLYTVTSTQTNLPEYKKFVVQRRFRHFDALQERLRTACPGAILPPRPPKHEGLDVTPGSKQSAAFAVQRASELNLYIRSLIVHPIAGNSEPLQFFLTFVDRDLGTAWPEVSNNALTRLTAGINKTAGEATAAAAAGMTTLSNGVTSIQHAGSSIVNSTTTGYPNTRATAPPMSGSTTNLSQSMASIVPSDQNVDLAQLLSNESHRMNLVTQAIPKLEGCLILLKDVQQAQGLFAMEWSKLSKDMKLDDKPISRLSDIMGLAMLKTARRNRKNVSDSFKILVPLLQQSKLVSMEKCAILDRQQALEKVWKLRQSHQTAQQSFQSQQHIYHTHPMAQQFHAQAHYSGQLLEEATQRADVISNVLHGEILRSQETRRQDIFWSLKLFSSTMKDTQRDVTQTWKDALVSFKKSFPVE